MSSYLTSLKPSPESLVSFKHIPFNVKIQYPFGNPKFIGMIAGGTGITPMIQALHALLDSCKETAISSTEDNTATTPSEITRSATQQVALLYGSRTYDDILAKELVDSWAASTSTEQSKEMCRFSVTHVLSHEPADAPCFARAIGHNLERGHINRELIEKTFPGPDAGKDVIIFVCGPPPMYAALCGPREEKEVGGLLAEIGYSSDQVNKF